MASIPVLEGAEWLVVLGPIFLMCLLLFISGLPLLEVCFPFFSVICFKILPQFCNILFLCCIYGHRHQQKRSSVMWLHIGLTRRQLG